MFLDFEPIKGKEIGKYRPALVLSSKAYNQKSGLLICCPISTSIRGQPTEVPGDNLDSPSSSRPRAAAESLFTNDPSLVRCGRPETSIMGIVFDGRRAKVGDISTWKF